MTFKFTGVNPAPEQYTDIGTVGEFDGAYWNLFSRPGPNEATTLDLVAQGRVPNKANYRDMVWDGEKLKDGKAVTLLNQYRTELYEMTLAYLQLNVPRGSDLLTPSRGRNRTGSHPTIPDWEELCVIEHKRVPWVLYRKHVGYRTSWVTVKLAAKGFSALKANYLLKWNGTRLCDERESQLLAQYRPDLHTEVLKALKAAKVSGKKVGVPEPESPWSNLGPVGEVAKVERDLLVKVLSENDTEVRLSTSEPDVPTTTYFVVRREEDGLTFNGTLYNSLRRNTPEVCNKVEELLKQYFLEKDFY